VVLPPPFFRFLKVAPQASNVLRACEPEEPVPETDVVWTQVPHLWQLTKIEEERMKQIANNFFILN
jgi:hypothetical protein